MSDMWIRRTFKSVSPDNTKGVFRKLKKGRGRTLNGGSPISGVSDRAMTWLGRVLVFSSLLVPILLLAFMVTNIAAFGMVLVMLVPLVHLFLIVGEMVTHRELPHRFFAMKLIWFPILVLMIFSFLGSLVP
ncbi:hypothetical protein N9A94_05570 [Akkermansiaceae bacterium]|nr:hypothetical protein [Akkermansiaceae bacterium]MDA7888266.1 hypothetical protein [Akkermansiaceae bacterium]MDB4544604.1 hypothetical protein [Akkermansiaceae bacterium]